MIKAKFKLEDNVRESLCLPEAPRRQCRDLNQEAFSLALSLASEEARQRFESLGTKLVFSDDSVSPWGPGWEFQFNLHYEKINETHTNVFSTSLISEPDFIIASAAGTHSLTANSPLSLTARDALLRSSLPLQSSGVDLHYFTSRKNFVIRIISSLSQHS